MVTRTQFEDALKVVETLAGRASTVPAIDAYNRACVVVAEFLAPPAGAETRGETRGDTGRCANPLLTSELNGAPTPAMAGAYRACRDEAPLEPGDRVALDMRVAGTIGAPADGIVLCEWDEPMRMGGVVGFKTHRVGFPRVLLRRA